MTNQNECPRDELLAALDAGALSPAEERDLRAHLPSCEICRAALEENRAVARTLRAIATPRPSQAARDRAYGAVLQAMELGKGAQAPAQAAPRASARTGSVKPAAPAGWYSFRVLAGGLAAAACFVIVATTLQVSSAPRAASEARQIAKYAPEPAGALRDSARVDEPVAGAPGSKDHKMSAPVPPMKPVEGPLPAPSSPPPSTEEADLARAKTQTLQALEGNKTEAGNAMARKGRVDLDREIRRRALINEARERVLVREHLERAAAATASRGEEQKKSQDATPPVPAPNAPGEAPRGGASNDGGPRRDAGKAAKKPDTKNDDTTEKEKGADLPTDKAPPATPKAPSGQRYHDPANASRGVLVEGDGKPYWIAGKDVDEFALITSKTAISRDNPVMVKALLRALDAELERQPHDDAWAHRVLLLAEAAGEDSRAQAEPK